jgi:hypothetical protein
LFLKGGHHPAFHRRADEIALRIELQATVSLAEFNDKMNDAIGKLVLLRASACESFLVPAFSP